MTCTTERVHVRGWLCRTDRFYHDNILYRINEKDHHEKILPEKKINMKSVQIMYTRRDGKARQNPNGLHSRRVA